MKVYLFLYLSFFFLLSCTPFLDKGGFGRSPCIQASKNIGVFLARYYPSVDSIQQNNKLIFKIHEAWLEHGWSKYDSDSIIKYDRAFQFLMIMDSSVVVDYNTTCCKDEGGFEGIFIDTPMNYRSKYANLLGGDIRLESVPDSIPIQVLDTVWTNNLDRSRLKTIWFYKEK